MRGRTKGGSLGRSNSGTMPVRDGLGVGQDAFNGRFARSCTASGTMRWGFRQCARMALCSVAVGVGVQYAISLAASLRVTGVVPGSGVVVAPSRANWEWVGAAEAGWAREPWMCGEEAGSTTWEWRAMVDPFEVRGSRGAGVYQSGYPMRSLVAAEAWRRDEMGGITWVSRPLARTLGFGQPGRSWCMPLRPLWKGMAVNAGVVALAVWVAWAGLLSVRERRRAGLGLCSACGYDLRGIARCPECGTPRVGA